MLHHHSCHHHHHHVWYSIIVVITITITTIIVTIAITNFIITATIIQTLSCSSSPSSLSSSSLLSTSLSSPYHKYHSNLNHTLEEARIAPGEYVSVHIPIEIVWRRANPVHFGSWNETSLGSKYPNIRNRTPWPSGKPYIGTMTDSRTNWLTWVSSRCSCPSRKTTWPSKVRWGGQIFAVHLTSYYSTSNSKPFQHYCIFIFTQWRKMSLKMLLKRFFEVAKHQGFDLHIFHS